VNNPTSADYKKWRGVIQEFGLGNEGAGMSDIEMDNSGDGGGGGSGEGQRMGRAQVWGEERLNQMQDLIKYIENNPWT